MTTKYSKPGRPSAPAPAESPVFPKEIHHPRPAAGAAAAKPKSAKRDNVFSQSRDLREDRDSRQIKNSHNSQTLPHGR